MDECLADNYENIILKEKANLFNFLMKNMIYQAERNPNGEITLKFVTYGGGNCEMSKKVLKYKYFAQFRDTRSKEERFKDYLQLKGV